jgi:hypothetical protein
MKGMFNPEENKERHELYLTAKSGYLVIILTCVSKTAQGNLLLERSH